MLAWNGATSVSLSELGPELLPLQHVDQEVGGRVEHVQQVGDADEDVDKVRDHAGLFLTPLISAKRGKEIRIVIAEQYV